MFGKRVPGELDLGSSKHLFGGSQEIVRAWVEPKGPATFFIDVTAMPGPFTFGMLVVDLVRHAAMAYARRFVDADEAEALRHIWAGVDAERAKPTTELTSPSDPLEGAA